MKLSISAMLLILLETRSVLSQNPACGIFDFNDPSIFDHVRDCNMIISGTKPMIIESYSDSKFPPHSPDSEYYLTTNKSVNPDVTQCVATRAFFRGNFSSFWFRVGINAKNNNNIDEYNHIQLFVSNLMGFQIHPDTNNGWQIYAVNYSFPAFGSFEKDVIAFRVRLGNNSDLAVSFIRFYNPQETDENCVPLHMTSTQPPVNTTTPEIEATTTLEPQTTTPTTSQSEIPTTPETKLPACLEVDFDNPLSLLEAFQECHLQYLPKLIIKSYANSTITPYRSSSLYYLSNQWEGYSCLETNSIFSLTEASVIESVIFLKGDWPGAWIEISVKDGQTGEGELIKRLEIENNWIRFSEEIKGKYNNAQIFIKTNMNAYSHLAVEYFNIRSGSC